jgi:hypothetical protein
VTLGLVTMHAVDADAGNFEKRTQQVTPDKGTTMRLGAEDLEKMRNMPFGKNEEERGVNKNVSEIKRMLGNDNRIVEVSQSAQSMLGDTIRFNVDGVYIGKTKIHVSEYTKIVIDSVEGNNPIVRTISYDNKDDFKAQRLWERKTDYLFKGDKLVEEKEVQIMNAKTRTEETMIKKENMRIMIASNVPSEIKNTIKIGDKSIAYGDALVKIDNCALVFISQDEKTLTISTTNFKGREHLTLGPGNLWTSHDSYVFEDGKLIKTEHKNR